jgi:hypothetical protein
VRQRSMRQKPLNKAKTPNGRMGPGERYAARSGLAANSGLEDTRRGPTTG